MKELSYNQRQSIGFEYVLDALSPCSPYGTALVRNMAPFESMAQLETELINLQKAIDGEPLCKPSIAQLLKAFMRVKDIRKSAENCQNGNASEVDLFEIKRFLLQSESIFEYFNEIQPYIQWQDISIRQTTQALDIVDIDKSRIPSFHISDSHSQNLRRLRREKRLLEEQARQQSDHAQREQILQKRLLVATEEEHEEQAIRKQLCEQIKPFIEDILHNVSTIGQIDVLLQKAELTRNYGGVMPKMGCDNLRMEGMINPKVSDLLRKNDGKFTPISISPAKGATVITGANMGGKSVALKTLALNIYMAHCGFFPCASTAEMPHLDGIYIISEDLESVDRGLSSFGGEVVHFSQVIEQAKGALSLILLDEFARGTNPDEGASIVQGVTEYFNSQPYFSVLATHYDGVAKHASAHYQVIGLRDMDIEKVSADLRENRESSGVQAIARHMNYGLFKVSGQHDCPKDALSILKLLAVDEEILSTILKFY